VGRSRILVVDDDRTMLHSLTDMVEGLGYEVVAASSWTEALRSFRSARPAAALLDVMMPTIDGYKLTRMLKSEAGDAFVPIILLTALDDVASKRRGMASGADDFLSKPVHSVELEIRLKSMLRIKELADELQLAKQRLERLAVTDSLTSLHNRRSLDEALEREFARARRYGHPLSVLMLDLDHFKQVNDNHGHAVGDAVLELVGDVLKRATRETDIVGRFGGEEFMMLAPHTPREQAELVGERIRELVASDSEAAENLPSVTMSVGLASTEFEVLDNGEQLVKLADDALYEAKRGGRNRVVAK